MRIKEEEIPRRMITLQLGYKIAVDRWSKRDAVALEMRLDRDGWRKFIEAAQTHK